MTTLLSSISLPLSQSIVEVPTAVALLLLATAIGLGFLAAMSESAALVSGDSFWTRQARFWQRLFLPCLIGGGAMLVIAILAIVICWQGLWRACPDLFNIYSAAWVVVSILLEALFVTIAVGDWKRLSRSTHLLFSWLAPIGVVLVAWWPMAVGAWAECPLATVPRIDTLQLGVADITWVAFSPLATTKSFLLLTVGITAGAAMGLGVACKYMLQGRNLRLARVGMWVCSVTGVIALFFTLCLGDSMGQTVAKQQPLKMASMQALTVGQREAPFKVVEGVEIPRLLSRLALHHNRAFMPGTSDIERGGYALPEGGMALSFAQKRHEAERAMDVRCQWQAAEAAGRKDLAANLERQWTQESRFLGYLDVASPDQVMPPAGALFWTFRIMVALGFLLFIVLALPIVYLVSQKKRAWLLRASQWVWALTAVATLCGGFISRAGSAPWAVADLLTLPRAATPLPAVLTVAMAVVVIVAAVAVVVIALRRVGKEVGRAQFEDEAPVTQKRHHAVVEE